MPSPGNLVIMGAGLIMVLASFLSFLEYSVLGLSGEFTAWSSDLFFPVTIIPVLFAVVMAAQVALSSFAPQVHLPEKLYGFTWNQVHLALAAQSLTMMLAFLIQNTGFDRGAGLWLMLLASIALVVGAVLRTREPASTN
jgi:hypothetical protein